MMRVVAFDGILVVGDAGPNWTMVSPGPLLNLRRGKDAGVAYGLANFKQRFILRCQLPVGVKEARRRRLWSWTESSLGCGFLLRIGRFVGFEPGFGDSSGMQCCLKLANWH